MTVIIGCYAFGSAHGTVGDRNRVDRILDFADINGAGFGVGVDANIDRLGSASECDGGDEDDDRIEVATGNGGSWCKIFDGGTDERTVSTRSLIHVVDYVFWCGEGTKVATVDVDICDVAGAIIES